MRSCACTIFSLFLLLLLLPWGSHASSNNPDKFLRLRLPTVNVHTKCAAYRLNIEVNNIRHRQAPEECRSYLEDYVRSGQYMVDAQVAIDESIAYLNGLTLVGDGQDAWIFAIDDTALSTFSNGKLPVNPPERPDNLPALEPTLSLYNQLIAGGVKVFFITARSPFDKDATERNLANVGYKGYDQIFYKPPRLPTAAYKASIRHQLMDEGYRILGNVGDQWSDLGCHGFGEGTFKLPNPVKVGA